MSNVVKIDKLEAQSEESVSRHLSREDGKISLNDGIEDQLSQCHKSLSEIDKNFQSLSEISKMSSVINNNS